MKLKPVYATEMEIPEGYAELYVQRGNIWAFDGFEGLVGKAELEAEQKRSAGLEQRLRQRQVADEVRLACGEAGIHEEGKIEDVIVYAEPIFEVTEDGRVLTRDSVGVTPGISPSAWLKGVNDSGKKKHWWPSPSGGGATGNDGKGGVKVNPWKRETLNLTEQGRIFKQDPALAERLKKEAGLTA